MIFDAMRDFFFQAEDGIRDTSVTGVQTCALPISSTVVLRLEWPHPPGMRNMHAFGQSGVDLYVHNTYWGTATPDKDEIGRASCREEGRRRGSLYDEKRKREQRGRCEWKDITVGMW